MVKTIATLYYVDTETKWTTGHITLMDEILSSFCANVNDIAFCLTTYSHSRSFSCSYFYNFPRNRANELSRDKSIIVTRERPKGSYLEDEREENI